MFALLLLLLPSLYESLPHSQELKNCDSSGPRVSALTLNSALSTFLCYTEKELAAMEEDQKKRKLALKIAPSIRHSESGSFDELVEALAGMTEADLVKMVNVVINSENNEGERKTLQEYIQVIEELIGETGVESELAKNLHLVSLLKSDLEDQGRGGRGAFGNQLLRLFGFPAIFPDGKDESKTVKPTTTVAPGTTMSAASTTGGSTASSTTGGSTAVTTTVSSTTGGSTSVTTTATSTTGGSTVVTTTVTSTTGGSTAVTTTAATTTVASTTGATTAASTTVASTTVASTVQSTTVASTTGATTASTTVATTASTTVASTATSTVASTTGATTATSTAAASTTGATTASTTVASTVASTTGATTATSTAAASTTGASTASTTAASTAGTTTAASTTVSTTAASTAASTTVSSTVATTTAAPPDCPGNTDEVSAVDCDCGGNICTGGSQGCETAVSRCRDVCSTVDAPIPGPDPCFCKLQGSSAADLCAVGQICSSTTGLCSGP